MVGNDVSDCNMVAVGNRRLFILIALKILLIICLSTNQDYKSPVVKFLIPLVNVTTST